MPNYESYQHVIYHRFRLTAYLWPAKTSLTMLWLMATAAAPADVTPLLWCCCYVRATAVLFDCCCSCHVCDMFLLLTPASMVIMQVTPSRRCVSTS